MRDYSFRYMDRLGRSGPSDFLKFADDGGATQFARGGLAMNAVVEVWRGNVLVIRLDARDRDASLQAVAADTVAAEDEDDKPHVLAGTVNILPLHGYPRPMT